MLDIPKIRAVLDAASRWDMDLEQFACWGHAHLPFPCGRMISAPTPQHRK